MNEGGTGRGSNCKDSMGDIAKMNNMQKMHMVGTGTGISGKIVYGANGDFNLTIPLTSPFGNYTLEGSWGYIGHNILTECYAGGCENNILTTVTPNHIGFTDNRGDTIHLIR